MFYFVQNIVLSWCLYFSTSKVIFKVRNLVPCLFLGRPYLPLVYCCCCRCFLLTVVDASSWLKLMFALDVTDVSILTVVIDNCWQLLMLAFFYVSCWLLLVFLLDVIDVSVLTVVVDVSFWRLFLISVEQDVFTNRNCEESGTETSHSTGYGLQRPARRPRCGLIK